MPDVDFWVPGVHDFSSPQEKLSVLLVGLGEVAMGYDLSTNSMTMKSHAFAYARHSQFRLAAAVDPDQRARDKFSKTFRIPSFASVAEASATAAYDLVVVASPTKFHLVNILEVLERFTPRVILCEKPLSYDIASAIRIVEDCRVRGVKLFVNYHRRVDPAVQSIRNMIATNEMKPPFNGTVESSKGLIHNGTHFLDLLTFWFGKIIEFQVLSDTMPVSEEDGKRDLKLILSSGSVNFLTCDVAPGVAEITLEFENGSLNYLRGGRTANWRARKKGAPTSISANSEVNFGPRLDFCQYFVADAISNEIQGKPSNLCTGEEGIEILELALAMLRRERVYEK